jgi:peroxiredoxin
MRLKALIYFLLSCALVSCIPLGQRVEEPPAASPAATKAPVSTSTKIVVSLPPKWTSTPSLTPSEILPTFTPSLTFTQTEPATKIPNLAPDFYFVSLDGKSSHLRDFSGTPMVLFFAMNACAHCQKMLPRLENAHVQYPTILMLLIDSKDDLIITSAFLSANKATFMGISDPSQTIMKAYKVTTFPTLVLINSYGSIVGKVVGEIDAQKLDAYLQSLLMLSVSSDNSKK